MEGGEGGLLAFWTEGNGVAQTHRSVSQAFRGLVGNEGI